MSQVDSVASGSLTDDEDDLFMDAVEMVAQAKQASVSMIQRRFRVGYNRAARLVDMMEERDIVRVRVTDAMDYDLVGEMAE